MDELMPRSGHVARMAFILAVCSPSCASMIQIPYSPAPLQGDDLRKELEHLLLAGSVLGYGTPTKTHVDNTFVDVVYDYGEYGVDRHTIVFARIDTIELYHTDSHARGREYILALSFKHAGRFFHKTKNRIDAERLGNIFWALKQRNTITSVASHGTPEFRNMVNELYDYDPCMLSKEEGKDKSQALDVFWAYVGEDAQQRLPLLRFELRNPANAPFFFYDASKLLLSLSEDPRDRQLALDSLPKADLRCVLNADYLRTIHWLATLGYDTTSAALRILKYPDFKAYIPQHAVTLGQDYSFIYMLFPMEEHQYLDALAQRLAVEEDITAAKSLILALWYTMSGQGQEILRRYSDTASYPTGPRIYAEQLLRRRASLFSHISFSPSARIRRERRQVIRRSISDETLVEFDDLTEKLLARQ